MRRTRRARVATEAAREIVKVGWNARGVRRAFRTAEIYSACAFQPHSAPRWTARPPPACTRHPSAAMGGKESKPSSAEMPSAKTPSTSTSSRSSSATPTPDPVHPSSRSSSATPTPDPARLERLAARQTAILASLERIESRLVADHNHHHHDDDASAAPNSARARERFPLPAGPRRRPRKIPIAPRRGASTISSSRAAPPRPSSSASPRNITTRICPSARRASAPLRAPHVQDHLHGEHEVHSGRLRGPGEQPMVSRARAVHRAAQSAKAGEVSASAQQSGGGKWAKRRFTCASRRRRTANDSPGMRTGGDALRDGDMVPVLVSREMEKLTPGGEFWLGGGEVDLKMRVSYDELVSKFDAVAVDCTYDE